jgi:hypothetical protein
VSIAIAGGAIAIKVTPVALKVIAAAGLLWSLAKDIIDAGLPLSGFTFGPEPRADGAPGPMGPVGGQGTLQALANEIREAGAPRAARCRVIAVGVDSKGKLWAGSSNNFDKGMREAAKRLGIEMVKTLDEHHAEENLMEAVPDLRAVGTSPQEPCPGGPKPKQHDCNAQLEAKGIFVDNKPKP